MRLLGTILLLGIGSASGQRVNVRYLGDIIEKGNGARIVSQDGAYSIDLGQGSLWVYGDTFYGTKKKDGSPDIKGAVSNSAARTGAWSAADGLPALRALRDARGNAAPLIPYAPFENRDKLRLWPGHGVKIGEKIYVFYSLVEILGPGTWDFRHGGQGLAVGKDPLKPFHRLTYRGRYDFWDRSEPNFGMAVLKGEEGWVYVYGRDQGKASGLKLARVRPEFISDPERYEYFSVGQTKAAWASRPARARPLFEEAPPEGSVSFNRYLGKYLMLYSRFLEQDVVMRVSDIPWGPWSSPKTIYRCGPRKPDSSCYAAKEHPEYAREDGKRIYFTLVDSGRVFGGMPELFEATIDRGSEAK